METTSAKKEILERKKVKKKMSKAQMQLAIIKKKQCDAKALIIVEQLLEPDVDSTWLLSNLRYINKSHMEDVIEERSIIRLCGYVLCDKVLTATINQRYHISTKKNKVYDVTRRKNFCSSRCYGASNYLLEQMLTSPLWLRDKEEIPKFKVLPAKDELEKSIPGDEIDVRDINLVSNPENKDKTLGSDTHKSSNDTSFDTCIEAKTYNECSVEVPQTNNESTKINDILEEGDAKEQPSRKFDEKSKGNEDLSNSEHENHSIRECVSDNVAKNLSEFQKNTLVDCTVNRDSRDLNKDVISLYEDANQNVKDKKQKDLVDKLETKDKTDKPHTVNNAENCVQKMHRCKPKGSKQKNSVTEKQSNEFYNLAMHIEQCVKEWITEDTIGLLTGEEDVKNRLLDNVVQRDRYLHLCKKLNKLQLEDEKDDRADLTTSILKPLPHLSILREEGKKIELKVRAFYMGSTNVENSESISESNNKNSDFTPVLPLTDAHASKTLRRRIFLDKLNRM